MLHRKVMEKLRSWKSQEHKKALCILGARQIGKQPWSAILDSRNTTASWS